MIGNIRNEKCKVVDVYYDDRLFVVYIVNEEIIYINGLGEMTEKEFAVFVEIRLELYHKKLIKHF